MLQSLLPLRFHRFALKLKSARTKGDYVALFYKKIYKKGRRFMEENNKQQLQEVSEEINEIEENGIKIADDVIATIAGKQHQKLQEYIQCLEVLQAEYQRYSEKKVIQKELK